MMKKAAIVSSLILVFGTTASSQNQDPQPAVDFTRLADSTSKAIDSMIDAGKFYRITVHGNNTNEAAKRQYFLDTAYRIIVKAIIDTSFTDVFYRKFNQVVFYFHGGSKYKSCWKKQPAEPTGLCTVWNVFSSSGDPVIISHPYIGIETIFRAPGKLKQDWTEAWIDVSMREFVKDEIDNELFIQRRHGND